MSTTPARPRSSWRRVALLVALATSGCRAAANEAGRSSPPAAAARRPNVILIVADDLGSGELGCYGQTKIRTPNLDRLAAQGLRFTQFYAGAPVCAPSRCTLLTGLHSGHAFIRDNGEVQPEGQLAIPDETVTLAEVLRAEGYATGVTGKWGLGGPGTSGEPNRQGFDHWFGYLCQREAHNHFPDHLWRDGERVELAGNARGLTGAQYSHDLFAEDALAFVRAHAAEPFFLYVPFAIPHLAIQVPEDSLEEYRGRWDDPPYDGKHGYLPHPAPRAGYAAMVTRMDRDVGRLVDLVDELGLGQDTLILFTSDNGPTYDRLGGSDSAFFDSAAGLRGQKGSVYEGGLRVPLIARWTRRVAAGGVQETPWAFWDVLPTLAQVCGARTPRALDGLSFAATLSGSADMATHTFLYWEFRAYGGQQAVRAGRWKGVRRDMAKGNRALELYDLEADPAESRDVARTHPEVVLALERVLADEHVDSVAFPLAWK